jgi:hypothetical protein
LLLAGWAEAKDIFVDNQGGNDLYTGLQLESPTPGQGPVRTIARALRVAAPGDRIVLQKTDQPYRESITITGTRCSGIKERPFVLLGNGAILDGSAPVPTSEWKPFRGAVFCFQPPKMAFQQLFLNERPAVRVFASSQSSEVPELKPRQWCSVAGQIYFCVEKGKLPGDYPLSYANLQTGITLYHVDQLVINQLTVQGFQVDGIALANSARNVSLVGTTCRGNGRCGVSVGGACSLTLNDCLLGDNGTAQLLTQACSETHIHNCHLLPNTAPGWVDQGGRVYLEDRRVQGGLDEIRPTTNEDAAP